MYVKKIIKILRLNQIIKHLFIFPGMIFGYYLTKEIPTFYTFLFGIISIILISSANYVINEITDRKFDIFHDLKKNRSLVSGELNIKLIFFLYITLLVAGFLISYYSQNIFFFFVILIFFLSGLLYNVPPIRLKDIPILDVICESFNNPIRFMLGFSFFFNTITLPSISLLLAYWLAGAFLMNSKRLSEFMYFKFLNKQIFLKKYRVVYNYYNFENLNLLSFFYASCSSSMLILFMIKYKVEYILILPIIIFIFSYYHFLSIKNFKKMQQSKNLIKMKFLIALLFILFFLFYYLSFNEIKILELILNKEIIYQFNK